MEAKKVVLGNKGMFQDTSISKSSEEFAFENHNIRITAVNDTTLFSVTNERGSEKKEVQLDQPVSFEWYTYSPGIEVLRPVSNVPIAAGTAQGTVVVDGVERQLNCKLDYYEITGYPSVLAVHCNFPAIDRYNLLSKYNYEIRLGSPEWVTASQNWQFEREDFKVSGQYLGKAIIDDYLVLFAHQLAEDIDYIYRVDTEFNITVLYKGNLNFSAPIETLASYESEKVQKVYFVDGINPNRVINITDDPVTYTGTDVDSHFDFVPVVETIPTVTIEKIYGGNGKFPAGTVQYFISYFNKLGQETKVVYASDLQYASMQDRGAKADETVNCNFKLTIENIDTSFDYLRVYSAKRTAIDGPIDFGIAAEVEISGDTVVVTDNNIDVIAQDSSLLSFIGGDNFIASTIEQKDNVAFFGDVSTSNIVLDEAIIKEIQQKLKGKLDFVPVDLANSAWQQEYAWDNQLKNSSKSVATFKSREWYRVGIQLQNSRGEWSEPVYIGDIQNDIVPTSGNVGENTSVGELQLDSNSLNLANWVNYRLLIAEPNSNTRDVLAQGIVTPTIFSYNERVGGNVYARQSWITRPFVNNDSYAIANDAHLASVSNTGSKNINELVELQTIDISKNPATEENTNSGSYAIVFSEAKYRVHREGRSIDSIYYYIYFQLLRLSTLSAADITANYNSSTPISTTDYTTQGDTVQTRVEWRRPTAATDPDEKVRAARKKAFRAARETFLRNMNISIAEMISEHDFVFRPSGWNNTAKNDVLSNNTLFVDEAQVPNTAHSQNKQEYISYIWYKDAKYIDLYDDKKFQEQYYVDQSIVTLNSPEIEYGDTLSLDNCKFRIVGYTPVNKVYKDYELEVTNPGGLMHKRDINPDKTYLFNDFLYEDYNVYKGSDKKEYINFKETAIYAVYMWNKQRSIIGQTALAGDDANHTLSSYLAELKHKVFSNYTYCSTNTYVEDEDLAAFPTAGTVDYTFGIKWVDSSSSLTALPSGHYYVGNNDILALPPAYKNTALDCYDFYTVKKLDTANPRSMEQKDPVRIKSSGPTHAVIELGETSNYRCILPNNKSAGAWKLPSYGVIFDDITISSTFPWLTGKYYDSYNSIAIRDTTNPVVWIGEIYRGVDRADDLYGDHTSSAILQHHRWIPASLATPIGEAITDTWGDTYFQRWECLRTYPTTEEDENSVVDVVSFMVETHINLDGRSDINRGPYNLNLKRPTNTNIINDAYSQKDNTFAYTILDDRFGEEHYPHQFTWSLAKSPLSLVDPWTSITMSNVMNVDGAYGPIREICKLNDTLIVFQDRAICTIDFNNRTQISTEQGLPIELANSGKVQSVTYLTREYGCSNKHSIINTKTGIYFIDNHNKKLMRINKDGITDISTQYGMSIWFKNNLTDNIWNGGELSRDPDQFMCHYEPYNGDIYIVSGQYCLVFNESLQTFTSFFDAYRATPALFGFNGMPLYLTEDNGEIKFNQMFAGGYTKGFSIIYRVNQDPYENKIFTNGEYIADWYKSLVGVDDFNQPEAEEGFNTTTEVFDTVRAWTEYQDTGDIDIPKDKPWLHPTSNTKFRVKRFDIPRARTNDSKYKLDRISNPWMFIKLSGKNTIQLPMQFHSLAITYYK